jgi:REP element-mobilizing transposase RayT
MRKDPLITGLYYHVYNRGVDKRDIFQNINDLNRFILSVKKFNTVEPIGSIKDLVLKENKQEDSDVGRPNPLVSIVCFCFNPNHIHFILKQEVDGGISEFFKRLLGGYTKYFNLIHKRSGSLFQGRFKSKLINEDSYFLKIRPYVHLNYMVHDIPLSKSNLVFSSEHEYDNNNFKLVSKKESDYILDFYGNNKNFKKESMKVISFIKEERGLIDLSDDEDVI